MLAAFDQDRGHQEVERILSEIEEFYETSNLAREQWEKLKAMSSTGLN